VVRGGLAGQVECVGGFAGLLAWMALEAQLARMVLESLLAWVVLKLFGVVWKKALLAFWLLRDLAGLLGATALAAHVV